MNQLRQINFFFILIQMLTLNLFCKNSAVKPSTISASSVLKPTPNYIYQPHLISDGNPNTTWAEGVAGDGIGEFVLFTFQNQVQIRDVEIINGFATMHPQLGDLYFLNNRLQTARIEFEDGAEEISLRDAVKTSQTIKFNKPHISKTAKLIIKGVYPGSKWRDTCISELSFQGKYLDQNTSNNDKSQWVLKEKTCQLSECISTSLSPMYGSEKECKAEVNRLQNAEIKAREDFLTECQKHPDPNACSTHFSHSEHSCIRQ